MIDRTIQMHQLEDAIDHTFDTMQRLIIDVIASKDDSKAIVELLTIMNDMIIQQLSNRGYIDMQRSDEPSLFGQLPVAHAD